MPDLIGSNHLQWPHFRPEKEGEDVFPVLELKFPHSLWRHHTGGGISLKPVKRTMVEQVSTQQPVKDTTPEQMFMWRSGPWRAYTGAIFPEGLQPMEDTHWSSRTECEEGATGRGCGGLTVTPISQPRAPLGRQTEESGGKLSLRKGR